VESNVQNPNQVATNILPLVVTLGLHVFVHEFGHFLFAKRAGVKVMKFSIGFGPRIFGWTRGETEYVVSWIPLGGYVKMLGENPGEEIPEEDRNRTLTSKPLRDKLLIVFAGPGMNLLLPVLLFMLLFFTGYPDLTSTIGTVTPGSPAAKAGIAPGDRIVAIDGRPVRWWEEVQKTLNARVNKPVALTVKGRSGERAVRLVPKSIEVKTILGDAERAGDVGVSPLHAPPLAAVSDPASPAGKAGIRTGDEITAIGGRKVVRREEAARALRSQSGIIDITVKRGGEEIRLKLALPATGATGKTDADVLASIGLERPEQFIDAVEKHSPADEGGLRKGDRLIALNGKPVQTWTDFTEVVRGSDGKPLTIKVRRNGEDKIVVVKPGRRFNRDPLAKERKIYYVGVGSLEHQSPGVIEPRVVLNPAKALVLSLQETWRMSVLVVQGMVKLATGQVRMDNIGGPIQIGVVAAQAAEDGFYTFIRMMAFISINLGILNLLPIPILDGGHLLFFLIEAAKRGPISLRKKELAQQVGLTMLLLLIGVAFYNDLARSWDQIVGFLKDVRLRFM
jgi:regulator of sigma E protease